MKKRTVLNLLIWIGVGCYVAWIFSNSLTIGEYSSAVSTKAANFLLRYVNRAGFTIDFNLFHHYVRKLAHFSEYALLGFMLVLAIRIAPLMKSKFLNFIIIMIGIPLTDELLQHFVPGRTTAFLDSFIDMAGILAGSFVAYVLVLIILDIFKKRSA
jgi:VanZ family protein